MICINVVGNPTISASENQLAVVTTTAPPTALSDQIVPNVLPQLATVSQPTGQGVYAVSTSGIFTDTVDAAAGVIVNGTSI